VSLFGFAMEIGLDGTSAKHFNGAVTESIVNDYMRSNGARQINAEVGRNGIDGLFYKKINGKMKVYTFESKYNNAKLGNTVSDGKQMSKKWKLAKLDEKLKELSKNITKNPMDSKKINKEINLIKEARSIVSKGLDKPYIFNIKPASQEYKELLKKKRLTPKQQNRLSELERLKSKGRLKSTYTTIVKNVSSDGKILGEAKNFKINRTEIDLKKQYKKSTSEHKQQKLLSHSIRKEKRLIQENKKLKTMKKNSPEYHVQKQKINVIKNSIPKISKSRASRRGFVKIVSSSSKSALKSGSKMIAKIGALSAASALPIVGVAAQIAADMYMAYQIAENTQAIEQNKGLIFENREYIQRLEREQEILGTKIEINNQNIDKLFSKVFNINQDIANLSSQLYDINQTVSKNSKEIQNIKDGILITASNQLESYYDSDKQDEDGLQNSINNFEIITNINHLNNDVNSIIINSMSIALIEKALLYKKNGKSFDFLVKKIIQNFNKIIEQDNRVIVSNAYMSMREIFLNNQSQLETITVKYKSYIKNKIDYLIEQNRYEDALYLAKIFKNDTADISLYKDVLAQREDNFNKYKNFTSTKSISEILENNQNNLLNKEAIKYCFDNNQFGQAIQLLQTKEVDNEEWKLRVFLAIYKYRDNTIKYDSLKNLILNNKSYSKELKKYTKSIEG
jgi:hypothetical protein